jgi:HK97 family phage prohead protease
MSPSPKPIVSPEARKHSSTDMNFSGYASRFGIPDAAGDIIMRGAFRASLLARGPKGIRMLFQHDPSQPLGTWSEIREDDQGLFVKGALSMGAGRVRDIGALLSDGAIDGLSIGFRTINAMRDRASGLRRLLHVDLWEISLVTFPMMGSARVSHMRRSMIPPTQPSTR